MKKRILMLGMSPAFGGTESVMFSMLPFWYQQGFVFDFINTYQFPLCRESELIKLGGRIWTLNLRRRGRAFAYRKSIRAFFNRHAGEYVGICLNMQEPEHALVLEQAKKSGVSKCIVVAHYAGFGAERSILRAASMRINRLRINRVASIRIAVSSLAGEYAFRGYKYSVVNSGIDCVRFAFDEQRRKLTRNNLGVSEEARLYVSAGRLTESKNFRFLLQIYSEIVRKDPNARCLIVGKGEMEQELRTYAKQHILDPLLFITDCDDISSYLDAADVFIFPSKHEGYGMVLIEAQCSGLPCFASECVIPREIRLSDQFKWVNLKQAAKKWADLALRCPILTANERRKGSQLVMNSGLTNEEVAQKYLRLFNEE